MLERAHTNTQHAYSTYDCDDNCKMHTIVFLFDCILFLDFSVFWMGWIELFISVYQKRKQKTKPLNSQRFGHLLVQNFDDSAACCDRFFCFFVVVVVYVCFFLCVTTINRRFRWTINAHCHCGSMLFFFCSVVAHLWPIYSNQNRWNVSVSFGQICFDFTVICTNVSYTPHNKKKNTQIFLPKLWMNMPFFCVCALSIKIHSTGECACMRNLRVDIMSHRFGACCSVCVVAFIYNSMAVSVCVCVWCCVHGCLVCTRDLLFVCMCFVCVGLCSCDCWAWCGMAYSLQEINKALHSNGFVWQ